MNTTAPPPQLAAAVTLLDRAERECTARGDQATSDLDNLTIWHLDANLARGAAETLRGATGAALPELAAFEPAAGLDRWSCYGPPLRSSAASRTTSRTCPCSSAGSTCPPPCSRSAATMSQPTVGELLAADRAALQLGGATEPNDALPLATGWRDVLGAAYEVLAAIPEPAVGERRAPTPSPRSTSSYPASCATRAGCGPRTGACRRSASTTPPRTGPGSGRRPQTPARRHCRST